MAVAKSTASAPRPAPQRPARRVRPAEADLDPAALIQEVVAKLQTKGNAEAERLREAIPTGGCGSDSRSRVANPNYPGSMSHMGGLRARVQNGRLVVDEPTTLPEGTVVDLVLDDEGDDLGAAERTLRDDAIEKAWQQAQAGQGRPAADVVRDLRRC